MEKQKIVPGTISQKFAHESACISEIVARLLLAEHRLRLLRGCSLDSGHCVCRSCRCR